ncbi:unnamed protein product [Ectocarpus sp. 6 AP-2014]
MEEENIIMIRGFPVSFPKGRKPFAPQLALMSKLLVGVQKGENCLLESPTGTGKTLALLCAALAWQRQQREQGVAAETSDCESEEEPMIDLGPQEPLRSFDDFRYVEPKMQQQAPIELAYEDAVEPGKQEEPAGDRTRFYDDYDDDDDDVFESPKKKRQKNKDGEEDIDSPENSDAPHRDSHQDSPDSPVPDEPDLGKPPSEAVTPADVKPKKRGKAVKQEARRKRAPRVYFCSRTHSQLNQVVAELRTCRTAFQDTSAVGIGDDGKPFSMALLASRKSTCINREACSDPKGIDDACKRLLKEKACTYYSPYNYLVDPGVREIMGINLKNAVVIFDEAHNLEDCAREAASAKLSLRALANAAGEMHRLGAKSLSLSPSYDLLRGVIIGVQAFLEEEDSRLTIGSYEKAHKVYKGAEALGLMQSRAGVTSESLVYLKEALKMVINEDGNADPYARDQADGASFDHRHGGDEVLSSGSVHVTASLVKVLGFLLTEGMENVDHYKMVVLRERGPWEPVSSRGRRGRNRPGSGSITAMETYLCFWCQSASTCFSEIDKQVHSVVLTSGTLSPMNSFAGELGIEFPHRLEANHVINVKKQCLVTSVGYFGKVSLDARYTNQHDLKYQDALGNALLQHARVVPGGILVFFPSYGLMDKMHDRWEVVTGLLQALQEIKGVYLEPRGQGKIDGVLAEYYEDIAAARENQSSKENQHHSSTRTGAMMLAVARGKVSEGIDFSDDAARMCVIVGIPYPSSKDLQVMLKKEYQDQRRTRDPRLVGGRAWYSLQAFRAVNQAVPVGVCIRHRSDFGAIVLCDPRYASSTETTASLSKWVRSSVRQCRSVEVSLPLVEAFFRQHQPQKDQHHAVQPEASACAGSSSVGGDGDAGCCASSNDGTGGCGESRGGLESKPEGAAEGSLDPGLVQQSLSQMFRQGCAASNPTDDPANGGAASLTQGTDGRTALQLLSQGTTTNVPRVNPTITAHEKPHADPEPRRPEGSLWCRKGGARISGAPPGAISGVGVDGPRLATAMASTHLYRTIIALTSDCTTSSGGSEDGLPDAATVIEVPRGWPLVEKVSQGEGRWVAGDGLVYAPLYCSCPGCRLAHIGEKVIAAGLGFQETIGQAWFFPSLVHAVGID